MATDINRKTEDSDKPLYQIPPSQMGSRVLAKQLQDRGKNRFDATVEASKQRLRPILMTSFAFILGVLPLVLATGAGAEMRVGLGVAVIRWFSERKGSSW